MIKFVYNFKLKLSLLPDSCIYLPRLALFQHLFFVLQLNFFHAYELKKGNAILLQILLCKKLCLVRTCSPTTSGIINVFLWYPI